MTDRELIQQAFDTIKHLCLHSRAIAGYDGETVQSGVNAIKKRLARTDREWQGLTDEEILDAVIEYLDGAYIGTSSSGSIVYTKF